MALPALSLCRAPLMPKPVSVSRRARERRRAITAVFAGEELSLSPSQIEERFRDLGWQIVYVKPARIPDPNDEEDDGGAFRPVLSGGQQLATQLVERANDTWADTEAHDHETQCVCPSPPEWVSGLLPEIEGTSEHAESHRHRTSVSENFGGEARQRWEAQSRRAGKRAAVRARWARGES